MKKEITEREYGISTLKGLIGAIPFAGTFLNELAFEARSRIKQERINSFVVEFSEMMAERTSSEFDLKKLNSEQMSDVFEELIISVSKTGAKHKREIFKKILIGQLLAKKNDSDELIRHIQITNNLSNIQFKILSIYNSLSDRMLKYKIQIIELEDQLQTKRNKQSELESRIVYHDENLEYNSSEIGIIETEVSNLKVECNEIEKLLKKKRNSLQMRSTNPNKHDTFGLDRIEYVTEMQYLISLGLLFDFIHISNQINSNEFFGITKLGRWYMDLLF